jgi:hypothetical protein
MWSLILGISGLSLLGWFINTFTPDSFWVIALFFLIVGATTYFCSLFIFKIVRRAVLITLGVVVWLLLRFVGLRDWYYPVLLVPVLISLEVLFKNR